MVLWRQQTRVRRELEEKLHLKPSIFMMFVDDRAYKPKAPFFLKIGPYFASNTHTFEETILDLVLWRSKKDMRSLVSAVGRDAMEVRLCYEGSYAPSYGLPDNEEFVKMLIRDGCCILEVMDIMTRKGDPFPIMCTSFAGTLCPTNATVWRHLLLDILMIKNQIPLAFLRQLHPQLKYEEGWPFEEMLSKFVDLYFKQTLEVPNLTSASHLLDAARMKLLPNMMEKREGRAGRATTVRPYSLGGMSIRYSAIDLKDSGVKISLAAAGRVMWIPRRAWRCRPLLLLPSIDINRDSDFIFSNMVAYEQRIAHHVDRPVQPVSSYLRLLSDLVRTVADAQALTCRGIIDNQHGSLDDVVNFFKDLKLGDTYTVDMLSEIRNDINHHCQKQRISCCADLRRTYFRSPWACCSFAAAILLLILTSLQVIYAILAYQRSFKT